MATKGARDGARLVYAMVGFEKQPKTYFRGKALELYLFLDVPDVLSDSVQLLTHVHVQTQLQDEEERRCNVTFLRTRADHLAIMLPFQLQPSENTYLSRTNNV